MRKNVKDDEDDEDEDDEDKKVIIKLSNRTRHRK